MKPNMVFVINYFYPDYASTGQLLTELCLHLQHDFNITVIAAQPGYAGERSGARRRFSEDRLENIAIVRIRLPEVDKRNKWSRLRYVATYFFYAVWALLKQKNIAIIYTISQPPILGGLIGSVGKALKRARHIYNIQDFNPEQAEAVGFMRSPRLLRLARWIDTMNCKWADHIITVGQDMQETLVRRFANGEVTANTVINNWTDEREIVPLGREHPRVGGFLARNGLSGKFIVMYSGNLGLYYDLENLIRLTGELRHLEDLAFVFVGEGAMKRQMQEYAERHGIDQVYFLPYQAREELVYSLNAADVHLVVNQKGIKGVSVPSKIYGVMAAGKPVLGVLERGSEAYRLVEESGCGMLVEPGCYDRIVRGIESLYMADRAQLAACGMRGREYLERHLRKELSLDRYRRLLLSVVRASQNYETEGLA